jgi:tetratricopeptide (TPR) repeat protein
MDEHIVKGIVDVKQSEVALLLESGYLYMELGKWSEALEVFSGVAALIPHSDVPHLALGNLFFAQGKLPQALKAHREGLKANPQSALAHAHIGEVLLFQGNAEQAVVELKTAIDMDSTSLAADFARSLIEAHSVGCFAKAG